MNAVVSSLRHPGDARDRPVDRALLASVLEGLRETPKRISPVWFYDEHGSCLFDRICDLPEYYVTRTELAILRSHIDEIARVVGPRACIIEPGSGTSLKTRLLLDACDRPAAYVPVDVARQHLDAAAASLRREFPSVRVQSVCADFTTPFHVPRGPEFARRVLFFPGSTIGNFARPEAVRLLAQLRAVADGGSMLIGTDLRKDPAVLVPAYDDAQGVTAAFNLNALRHLNSVLHTDFDMEAFRHRAVWNEHESRIEMHLVSTRRQQVRVGDAVVPFAAGEALVSELSHKYTLTSFAALAVEAGWRVRRTWTDARRWFALHWLEDASRATTAPQLHDPLRAVRHMLRLNGSRAAQNRPMTWHGPLA